MSAIDIDFTRWSSLPENVKWMIGSAPAKTKYQDGLVVEPDCGTDFWRNTYYDPLLQAYNGHVLGIETTDDMVVVETQFTFKPQLKFDQAGVYFGNKESDWVKAGVEHVDGEAWQSVVVTRGDFSDWSKARLPWPKTKDIFIRMYRQRDSGVVEVSADGIKYEFVRIFHLPMSGPISIGVMVCRPVKTANVPLEECVVFKNMKISKHDGYHHDAS